jgi:hypothetical protein
MDTQPLQFKEKHSRYIESKLEGYTNQKKLDQHCFLNGQ